MKNQSVPPSVASAPLPRKASRKVPLSQSAIAPVTPGQRKRCMIPVDQIELLEEFAFREKIDEETVGNGFIPFHSVGTGRLIRFSGKKKNFVESVFR